MSSPAQVMLLAALVLTSACGGRVATTTHDATPMAGSASNPGAAGQATGGSGMATQPEPANDDDLPPMGVDGLMPPFETPWWLWVTWKDNIDHPIADQCRPGFTEQDGLAAITEYADQRDAVPVDAAGLLQAIEQFRDPIRRAQVESPFVVHLFATSDAHLGAISVIRTDTGILVYYFAFEDDCRAARLGFYTEYMNAEACDKYGGSPLWGVPEVAAERRQCWPETGFYAFEGTSTEDTCERAPARFSAVFHYRDKGSMRAEVVFTDVPVPELRRSSFGFRVETRTSEVHDATECGPLTMRLALDAPPQLRFEDERTVCELDTVTTCLWKMQSPRVYGPLN